MNKHNATMDEVQRILKRHKAMEKKIKANDVLPAKINQSESTQATTICWYHWFRKKKFKGGKEMAIPKYQKLRKRNDKVVRKSTNVFKDGYKAIHEAPNGIDPKVYDGVRIALNAMKTRQLGLIKKGNRTLLLSPDRRDQRLFSLENVLDEDQAKSAIVVLNGVVCVEGRDYEISGNILNWVSDRKLYSSDVIAVRYPLVAITHPVEHPANPAIGAALGQYFNTGGNTNPKQAIAALSEQLAKFEERVSVRTTELEMAVESLDTDLRAATFAAEVEKEEQAVEEVEEPVEEEDMIEPGVKVYHRLSGDGPWIVVQPTVLNIKSREEGGAENVFKSGFVELAWTVQTEDGVRDFPEVVLTSRAPKKERFWTWKKTTGAIVGASVLVGGIVHAPLILSMLGIIH